jgi:hypothetical protein
VIFPEEVVRVNGLAKMTPSKGALTAFLFTSVTALPLRSPLAAVKLIKDGLGSSAGTLVADHVPWKLCVLTLRVNPPPGIRAGPFFERAVQARPPAFDGKKNPFL